MSFLWGNTANQQQNTKKFANISDDQINSNQQAVPVKYLAGRNYVAGDFISPAYNPKAVPIKSESGKTQGSTTGYKYYADFALLFCTGGRRPVDALRTVIVDSDIRWTGNVQRIGTSYRETIQIDNGKLGTIHLYWGTESQPIDDKLLRVRIATSPNHQDKTLFNANHQSGATQFGGLDANDPDPYSGHYDQHPAYSGQCYAVFIAWKLGRDRTSVPNIQLELERGCPAPWLPAGFAPSDDKGVNPIAVLYDWLTDTRFGMALPDTALNLTNSIGGFAYAYTQLETVAGGPARISPLITSQSDFRQQIAELLGYYDGWIRRNGQKIEAGLWAKGNIPSGAFLTDDDLLAEPELEPQGFSVTVNELTVSYKDREHHFNDYVQVYHDPNNFRITGGPRTETLSRPWITDATLAKAFARSSGAAMALPFTKGDLTVRREWLDTNHILPGMVFTYSSGFYSTSFLVRLMEIEYAADKDASAKLSVEWERSKWPSLYIPPPFQGPGGFVIGPRGIWQSRITEVPYLLLDQKFDTQLVVLATRGNVEVQGFRIWFSLDPAGPGAVYQLIPDDASTSAFASFGKLTADTGTLQRVYFNLFGVDLDLVVSQLNSEMQDDNLLLFCGGEVMSVGAMHVASPPALGFWVNALRGRFGTTVANHTSGTAIFFLFRDRLRLLDNAGFSPGAVVQFKLQPFTADSDYDISGLTPISYTVVGFNDIAQPVLTPAPGTFVTSVSVGCSSAPAGFVTRFTRDGTAVKWTSQIFTPGGHTVLNSTKTIRIRFFHTESGRSSSETVGVYTKVNGPPPNNPQCAAPSWTYSGVLNHTDGNLVLSAVTTGSTIHWIKTSTGGNASGSGGGPLTVALLSNSGGDQLEYWASYSGYDDSDHRVIDNTKEINFGGGGHWPPHNPV